MLQPTHHHFRVTATLGAIALVSIAITAVAVAARQDGFAVTTAIVGVIFAVGFWFRWSASIAELAILDLLSVGSWWTGLELVERSAGALERGTVYVHLAHLEERGLIRSRLPTITWRKDEIPLGMPDLHTPEPRRYYAIVINRPPLAAGKEHA